LIGFIEITSKPNQGTRIDLYFPSSEAALSKDKGSISPSIYQGQGESILVVDDVPEQRMILSAMLNRLGYRLQTVSSGDEALAFIQRQPMDLIILDMMMEPGMDGLDTYRAILKVHPKQKAIITTGYAETERVKQALALGAADYIKKPYSFEDIGMAIHAAINAPFGE
jgi:CheY-like chemotaxis protein